MAVIEIYKNGKRIESIDLTPVTEFKSKLEKELMDEYNNSVYEGKFKLGEYDFSYYLEKAREMSKEQLEYLVTELVSKVIGKSRGEIMNLLEDKHREELKSHFEMLKKIKNSPEYKKYKEMGTGRIENPVTEPYEESDNTYDEDF